MNASKLSMPRRPVAGSSTSSGSGIGSHNRISSGLIPNDCSSGNRSLVIPISFAIGVGSKRDQSRVLRLPAETTDAQVTGRHVLDNRRTAADPVEVEIERVSQPQQRVVRNRLDEACAEERESARDAQ